MTHTGDLRCFAFSADGRRVVTGSYGSLAKIWDARTGAEVSSFIGVL